MHDLGSFLWVGKTGTKLDKWNFVDTEELANSKKGEIDHEGDFINSAENDYTSHSRPLVPWVNRLREANFPDGRRWGKEDLGCRSYVRRRQMRKR